jgi:predicted Zn-dependent peptidase
VLARAKMQVHAALIRRLADNAGAAAVITAAYSNFGDWRKLFTSLDDVDKVTAEDIQRVAGQYFVPKSRTMVYTVAGKTQGGAQ